MSPNIAKMICFRGDFASASLKRLASQLKGKADTVFPRRFRLGLIEAPYTITGISSYYDGFPRRFRLGLIEAPGIGDKLDPAFKAFPRRFRLGLIEASFPRYKSIPRLAFPRRFRLGLIEAADKSALIQHVKSVSEAISPRPH